MSTLFSRLGGSAAVDAVVENLAATLVQLGISDTLIKEVAGIAEVVRDDVLGH